jgi:radical SAM PhpK family P-methyltransferase
MSQPIDCVVVGYNDVDFDDLLERTSLSRKQSGGYRHLIVNSVPFRGRRIKYFDLLNTTIEGATGVRGRYHVAKMPNLGACYLVNFLRKRGLHAELVNFYNHEQDHFRDLLSQSPALVAITTTFYFEPQPIQEIVRFVREHSPTTKVVVGGPHIFNICNDHPPSLRDAFLQELHADLFVLDSQGELTLSRLCADLRRAHPDPGRIPNVIHRVQDDTLEWGPREIENNNMDQNAVDWSLFGRGFLASTVQTRTARSCAYKCAFCRYPIMAGGLDLASLETIERELDTLCRGGVKYLLFIDDTFNIPLSRFKEICRLMIRKQYGFKWFSYFRCANADRECFDLMADSGCAGVFLGIESGDDRVLKAMNKIATTAKYIQGITELNARGIITYASFIMGYPSETDETAENTLAFIEKTRPTFYCLETFFYDPKVPIATRADEFGLKGVAYAWAHNTMNWQRASDLVEEGYRRIRGSTPVPLYSFDLWSIAYLMGQGFTRKQIDGFLKIAATMLVRGINSDQVDTTSDEACLMAALRPSTAHGFDSNVLKTTVLGEQVVD